MCLKSSIDATTTNLVPDCIKMAAIHEVSNEFFKCSLMAFKEGSFI